MHCVRRINPCLLSDFSYRFHYGVPPRFSRVLFSFRKECQQMPESPVYEKLKRQRTNPVSGRKFREAGTFFLTSDFVGERELSVQAPCENSIL